MKIFTSPRTARHERDFLRTLGETTEFLGHYKAADPEDADLSIVWGWERPIAEQPTLFVESGWLPRWHYQVSPRGLNGESHVASIPTGTSTACERTEAERYLDKLKTATSLPAYRSSFGYADPGDGVLPRGIPESFIMAPLQVETDRNLARCLDRRMQGFIDRLSRWDPPVPIVFKRHPAKIAAGVQVETRREGDVLTDYRDASVHAYLRQPGCRAVVTLNSNTAHDALIWGVPVVALERGPWPSDGPFWTEGLPKSWRGFERFAAGAGMLKARLDYAAVLIREQWTFERAQDEAEVAELLVRAKVAAMTGKVMEG